MEAPVPQRKPLARRTSSVRGYHPRSASLRRMRSIQRRRILETSTKCGRPPAKRTVKMEAENKKVQEQKQLLAACARGDLKTVEKLVDSGVDVNSADSNQMTALHYAAMHARDSVIKSLISRGVEVKTADLKGGFTAMHWVVINSEPQYGATNHQDKSLTALAKAGCRVNATDFNFATPLHIASQKGNKGCVQTLMRLGADPEKVDITGRDCFDVAKCDQMKALLRRLHEKYSSKCSHCDDVKDVKDKHIYRVLEVPPPSFPPPPPPTVPPPPPPTVPPPPPPTVPPPPQFISTRKSHSDDHIYHIPEFVTPPSSPSTRTSSVTPPPPPPRRRRQYIQYSKDDHMYHVLDIPTSKPRSARPLSPPRRRKARKY